MQEKIEKINKKYIKLFFNVLFINWFFKKEIIFFMVMIKIVDLFIIRYYIINTIKFKK